MSKISTLIAEYNNLNLTSFLRSKINSFKPDDEDLMYLFNDDGYEKYETIDKVGEAVIENDDLIIISSKTTDSLTEKTGKKRQYEIAKKILKQEVKDAALFVFYDDEGNFRFSFIKANYVDNKRELTSFKRYSYFVSPEKTNKTFISQIGGCDFSSLDTIINAFSVEPLNKQFYQEIAKGFYSLIGGKVKIGSKNNDFNTQLKLPSTPLEFRKVYQEFGVRLIGRTIFCWFLKNKKSNDGLALIPEEWLSSKTVASNDKSGVNYYHTYLEKLFFLTLNKSEEDRIGFDLPDTHTQIPYLNGGLFEAHVDDFFVNGMANYGLKIPNQWFLDLFEVLEQYNFTIDENSINDAEVSIDPEMLGTIFENLLAEIDPDTEKSARKATGSFYTPREIVDYMVEQSLTQYLKTKTGIEDEDSLLKLFIEDGDNPFDDKETNSILEALSDVKILDPACGSGAFPMGALHKIIVALKMLDKGAVWWKERQLKGVNNALARKLLKEKLDASNSDYIRKLGVIQNSIYGVDIQPIATDISKLRSFLSLVIDENIDDSLPNRGIEPLPNLEFKFVTANTLISLPEEGGQQGIFDNQEHIEELTNLRVDYLQSSGKKKEKIREKFLKVQVKLFATEANLFGNQESRAFKLSSWNPFKNEASSWFDTKWMFGIDGFDIVIGNPPYIDSETMVNTGRADLREYLVDNYRFTRGNWDIYIPFFEKGFNSLNDFGVLCYITPDKWMSKKFGTEFREGMFYNLNSIVQAGRNIFETANVDALITVFTKDSKKINSYRINNKQNFVHINEFVNSTLEKDFSYDLLFSSNINWLLDLEKNNRKITDFIICESACATSDAYKLKEFVDNLESSFDNDLYYKVINTGTIDKYVTKWGNKEMRYLGDKYLNPVVRKDIFKLNFKNSYYEKSKTPKIIIKGLTLLDACLDKEGVIAPGKTTLVLCDKNIDNLKAISCIINSKISIFCIKEKFGSSSYNGGVTFNKGMINSLLIPNNFEEIYENLIIFFDLITEHKLNNDDELYAKAQFRLDVLIYKSFNIPFENVSIIDSNFNLSEEQYINFNLKD